jgi:hypothetical protein
MRGEPRTHKTPATGDQSLPARVVRGLRRLDLLLDRIEKDAGAPLVAGAGLTAAQESLLPRCLAAAAGSATDAGELDGSLDRIRRLFERWVEEGSLVQT